MRSYGRIALSACVCPLLWALAVAPGQACAADGDLDPAFGDAGLVQMFLTGGDSYDYVTDVAIDSRGRIVGAGSTVGESFGDARVIRLNEDGSVDASFGSGGLVTSGFGGHYAYASSVAVDAVGRIVLAGRTTKSGLVDFALDRYLENGSPDGSFGDNGTVFTKFAGGSEVTSLAIDSRDRIVAAGTRAGGLALARYLENGDLDPSFGNGGKVTAPEFEAESIAIDSEGRILVAGTAQVGSRQTFALARYFDDGRLDRSFGDAGIATADFAHSNAAEASSMAIDPRGRTVVAGGIIRDSGRSFAFARYDTDGTLDRDFGRDGKVTVPCSDAFCFAKGLAIEPRGRVLAVGFQGYDQLLVRLNRRGAPDDGFGRDGKVTTNFAGDDAQANAVAIDSEDRIVTAGGVYSLEFARYIGDAPPSLKIRGPRKITTRHRRARARFRLRADQAVTFMCRVDSRRGSRCSSPFTTRNLHVGKHRPKVRATDRTGHQTTKLKRFRIVRRP